MQRFLCTGLVVLGLLAERVAEAAIGPGGEDYKTRLQEFCAQSLDELPVYKVSDRGPDHAKVFYAEVFVGGRSRGHGQGRSKKQAEQVAARQAWHLLAAEVPEAEGAAEADVAGPDGVWGPGAAVAAD